MSKYSIVVPAYNEEKSLRLFYDAVTPVMQSLEEEYEILFINDGSSDGTKEILDGLAEEDARVKVCHFSRNFGQQAALLCGFEHASGDAVIAMDADLQDPPEVALQMIEKWKEGAEIVNGKRLSRKGETAFKRASAKLFYAFTRKITGLDLPQNVGDFKLYDRKVVNAVLSMGEHDRLLRAQTSWLGFKQCEVAFERPDRVAGETHYTLKKMLSLAKSGIFPNAEISLRFSLKAGLLLFACSLACFITFIVLTCCHVDFGGLTAWLFPTIGMGVSLILLGQGLSDVHTGMIYREVQNRPKYVLSEKRNFKN